MSLNELIEKIKLSGGRTTRTRTAILEYMFSSDKPVSSTDILSILKKKRILVNRTTVYRELAFLVDNCFAREVRLIGKPSLFELSHEHRHHLICVKCNNVQTIIMDNHLHEEEKKIMRKENFKIIDHSLEFYGLCKQCQ
ncbi:MAG: hypothetical protein C0412_15735 [Flavobacterium sp.]|nr:hypothetical protein [Flavobacterium sp.]